MQYTVYHLHQKAHNTQIITYIRRHTISAHHLNSYSFPHMLPATACVTGIEQWLLVTVLTLIFLKLFFSLILHNTLYIVYTFLFVTFMYCYM